MTISLCCYFGGKQWLVKHLVPLIDKIPHGIYVEPFGGMANILLNKRPVPTEVYNDRDELIVNIFRVVRDKSEELIRWCELTPYARSEWKKWEEIKQIEDDVSKAGYALYHLVNGISGRINSGWGYGLLVREGVNKGLKAWLDIVKKIGDIHSRLKRVVIDNRDFRSVISAWDSEKTLFYCDPPYVPDTRSAGEYGYEMTREDHEELVEILLNLKGKAILSGYPNDIYERLEREGWVRRDFDRPLWAKGRTQDNKRKTSPRRTECVWFSPNCFTGIGLFGLVGGKGE